MINNIIFSKDRACQLDALLRSLEDHLRLNFNHIVIYTYSNEKFKEGYEIAEKRHPSVKFVHEINLKNNILYHMNTLQICFMVDDMIMFKDSPIVKVVPEHTVFSLRLGCSVPQVHKEYPLSVDGHIFRTNEIKPLIENIAFNNPNKLEALLQKYKKKFKVVFDYQCCVSIPHNRVSAKSHCSFTGLYDINILNRYYLDGFVIDYDKMDFSNIKNVHEPIEYKFKSYD
jgi:hypothetical protein